MVEIGTQALIAICIIGFLVSALMEVLKYVFKIKNEFLINIIVLILSTILKK